MNAQVPNTKEMPGFTPVVETKPFGIAMQHHGTFAGLQVTTCTHEAGHPVPMHQHEHRPELFLVIDGTYEFTRGEETLTVGKGQMVAVPPKTPHGFVAVGGDATMAEFASDGIDYFVEIDKLGHPAEFSGGIDEYKKRVGEISANFSTRFL